MNECLELAELLRCLLIEAGTHERALTLSDVHAQQLQLHDSVSIILDHLQMYGFDAHAVKVLKSFPNRFWWLKFDQGKAAARLYTVNRSSAESRGHLYLNMYLGVVRLWVQVGLHLIDHPRLRELEEEMF